MFLAQFYVIIDKAPRFDGWCKGSKEEKVGFFGLFDDGYAYLSDPQQMRERAPTIAQALDILARHSPLGRRLVDHARKRVYGFRENKNFALHGGYLSGKIDVAANTLSDAVQILAHEIMHGFQDDYGLHKTMPDDDGRTLILKTLNTVFQG